MKLWTINRVLRWTGFRLMLELPGVPQGDTKMYIRWVGTYGSPGWMKWEPDTQVQFGPIAATVAGYGAACLAVGTLAMRAIGL